MTQEDNHEGMEPQGYSQSSCPCCGGTKSKIIWGKKYVEPIVQLPKKCECLEGKDDTGR
jgi:hypothetical protein